MLPPPEVGLVTFDETFSLWEPLVPHLLPGRQSSPGSRVAMELPGDNVPDSPAQGDTYQCKAHRPLKGWILISAQGERIAFRKERGFIELIAGGGGAVMTIWILLLKSVAGERKARGREGGGVLRLGAFQTPHVSKALLRWRTLAGWEATQKASCMI